MAAKKKSNPIKKQKEVIMILDSSGSMNQTKSDVIGSFNAFVDDQKKIKDDTLFYLYVFSSSPVPSTYKINGVTVDKIKPLTDQNYTPKGNTALTDAVCYCICDFKNKDTERFYVIYTDGEENDSKENTSESLKKMISEEESKGNKFEYMCASLDKFTLNKTKNFAANVGLNFTGSSSIGEMFKGSGEVLRSFRSS